MNVSSVYLVSFSQTQRLADVRNVKQVSFKMNEVRMNVNLVLLVVIVILKIHSMVGSLGAHLVLSIM